MISTNAPTRLPAVVALSGGAALLLAAVTAAPASAHDTLIGSTPEADEVLEESPEEIVLEFSGEGLTTGESIPNTIWVTDEDGENWEGETEVDGPTMRTELGDPLPDGEYEVLYHAVYSDGHSEELDFTFEVDAAEVEEEPVEEETDDAVSGEDAAQDDADAAEEPTAEESLTNGESGEDASAEEEDQFPVGVVLGIGAGVLVLIVVALLLVRRKLTQTDADQD